MNKTFQKIHLNFLQKPKKKVKNMWHMTMYSIALLIFVCKFDYFRLRFIIELNQSWYPKTHGFLALFLGFSFIFGFFAFLGFFCKKIYLYFLKSFIRLAI